MSASIEAAVREEVEGLHTFFVGWFSGRLAKEEFEARFLARFDADFILVPPAGTLLRVEDLASGVRRGHGTNPEFRIAIRNVRVRRVFGDHVLATYEEWQRNAIASTPPENARLATVLFARTDPLRWLHIHETWLPEAIASAGPYDF